MLRPRTRAALGYSLAHAVWLTIATLLLGVLRGFNTDNIVTIGGRTVLVFALWFLLMLCLFWLARLLEGSSRSTPKE